MVIFRVRAFAKDLDESFASIATENKEKLERQFWGGVRDIAFDEVKQLGTQSFQTIYDHIPFVHATGNYYKSVHYMWSKITQQTWEFNIVANVTYADCLEMGHGSFKGYHIMKRTLNLIGDQLEDLIMTILRSA